MSAWIAAAVKVVAGWLTAAGVNATVAYGVAYVAVNLAVAVAVSKITEALTPKPRGMAQGQQLQLKLDPAYPREVGVGVFATGGSVAFMNVSGDANEYLWHVIALSDCEIDSITEVRGDGAALTFSGDIHTGFRDCTSHYKDENDTPYLKVQIFKGTDSQTAHAELIAAFPSILDSNFRGRGVAYAVTRRWWSQDVWAANGILVFVGKGAKCYDPRTGTTVWTDNTALIAGQFLKGFETNGVRIAGTGCAVADLPNADLASAADECDELVDLFGGGTEKRYRAGGMISSRESAREIMTYLTSAMGGRHIDSGGEITLLPGVARTAVLDIDEDDLLADAGIIWVGRRTSDERVNAISSTFVNPADGYQEAPLPPRKNVAAIAADGGRFDTSRAYRFVYSKTQGQRLDEIELKRARFEGVLVCAAPLWALELTPGDFVTSSNKRWGGTQKTFEVISVGIGVSSAAAGGSPSARCVLTLQETNNSVFAWITGDELIYSSGVSGQPAALLSYIDNLGRLNGGIASGNPNMTGAVTTRSPLTVLSYSDAGSTETVSIAGHTLKTSDVNGTQITATYNSGSVTGLAFSTGYHIAAFDPNFLGGAVTYVASTSSETYVTDNRYVYVGYIVTGADGAGGGSPPVPPDQCVAVSAWIDADRQARDIEAGAEIDALGAGMHSVERVTVDDTHRAHSTGVRLVTTSGVALTCSTTTPITQPCGSTVVALRALGAKVAVQDAAGLRWETIVQCVSVGNIEVMRIHCGGRTYAAGDDCRRRMFTHNPLK